MNALRLQRTVILKSPLQGLLEIVGQPGIDKDLVGPEFRRVWRGCESRDHRVRSGAFADLQFIDEISEDVLGIG